MSRRPEKTTRRAKPRPNRKRRNLVPALFGLFCAGLVAEGAYAAFTSPRFAVKNVVVEGNKRVPAMEILRTAGIPKGANIFLVKADRKAERVARIPRVESVEIHRRFPDRMVVRVEERTPAMLLAAGNDYYLVDETGVPYSKLDDGGYKLPVLRLEPAPAFEMGQPLKDPAFAAGAKALPAVKPLMDRGAALWVDPHLNLCLNRGDLSARLGQPDQLGRKLRLLKGLLDQQPDLLRNARYVDLSAPETPALMPKDADGSTPSERTARL